MQTSGPGALPRAAMLACAVLVGMAGCTPQAADVPVATALCDAVTFPNLQQGSHLIGDTPPPIPYSSTPPTSGWHRSGVPPLGVFDTDLSEPAQVSTLEAGGVVITYGELDDSELATLRSVVEQDLSDRVALTAYDKLRPGLIVLASWGAMQRCSALDVDALRAYVDTYASTTEAHDF